MSSALPTIVFRGRPFLFSKSPFYFRLFTCMCTLMLSVPLEYAWKRTGKVLTFLSCFILCYDFQLIHLPGSDRAYFFLGQWYSVCVQHALSVEGRLGRFYVLVLGNNPAISMSVQVSQCWVLSLGSMPRSGMSGSHVNSVCGFIWSLAIHYDFHVNSAPAFLTSIFLLILTGLLWHL